MQESDTYGIEVDYKPRDSPSRRTIYETHDRFTETGSPLPFEMGEGKIHFEQHEDGFGFGELQTKGAKDRFEFRIAVARQCYKIPFLLSKDISQVGIEGTKNPVQLEPTASYLLSPWAVGTAVIPPELPLHLICFFVIPEYLDAVLDELGSVPSGKLRRTLSDTSGDPYLHRGIITPAIRTVIDQIRYCHMRGSLRQLYLEGKLLELAALRFQELCEDPGRQRSARGARFSARDREKIREAAEIASTRLRDPLSIPQLARIVGVNTTKLKSGFRSELGITVFGYVHRLRMEQALALLRDTDMNVTDVAWEVGYSNLSAFSAAFKRDFGFSPSAALK